MFKNFGTLDAYVHPKTYSTTVNFEREPIVVSRVKFTKFVLVTNKLSYSPKQYYQKFTSEIKVYYRH